MGFTILLILAGLMGSGGVVLAAATKSRRARCAGTCGHELAGIPSVG